MTRTGDSSRAVRMLKGSYFDRLLPKQHDYRGLSVTATSLTRVRILIEWLAKSVAYSKIMRPRLAGTRALRNSNAGIPALVIATGPSASTLDIAAAVRLKSEGGKVFAINYFNELGLANHIRPDYYVLADPEFLVGWSKVERARATWDYILSGPTTEVFVPAHTDISGIPSQSELAFFNGIGLDGWSRNTSPTRARGYIGLTAYSALAIALFLGHSPVFTIGIDNDVFKFLHAGPGGQIVIGSNHAYPDEREYPLSTTELEMGAALEDFARYFADIELFDTSRLVNLAPSTLINSYPQGDLASWLTEKYGPA